MSEFNIEVQGGSSVRLPTAGKYCEKDIIVTASGGGGTEEIENLIDESGVLDSTDGTATEKVEQLIDKAQWKNVIQESLYTTINNVTVFKGTSIQNVSGFDFSKLTLASQIFMNCKNLKSANVNTANASNFTNTFQGCAILETVTVEVTSKATNINGIFSVCTSLKSVLTALDCSSVTSCTNSFLGCSALEDIRFVPETIKVSITIPSPVLSDESIQSIIDGLADLTGGTAQTLTLHATVKAKLTETQLATITGKNWNLA